MKITWSFVILVGLGIVAALSAAVFTASISLDKAKDVVAATTNPEVTILVASANLTALDAVTKDNIVEKTLKKSSLPEKYYTDASQIIGKHLNENMLEGQTFTEGSFPREGSGAFLAAKLDPGMRAINIQLTSYEGLQGLLYPGSYVDVLASFKLQGNSVAYDAVSTTLLQSIEVLAVENRVVGSTAEEVEQKQSKVGNKKGPTVTLLVDSKQAEALQLAMKFGQISLTLRNPTDEIDTDKEPTLLAAGRLAMLADFLDTQVDGSETPSLSDLLEGDSKEGNEEVAVEAAPESESAPQVRHAFVVKGLEFGVRAF